ncbi:MAG: T9SS type A sorting domain-containing protein [Bacteroidetes bacterium]|nr:T9SS type A sorting domain-containing protein [Bacteroidota bacterium]
MNIRIIIIIVFFVFIRTNGHSQSVSTSVISCYGNYAVSSSGSLSANVGEPLVATFFNSTNFLTEGFEQPNDLLPLSIHDFSSNDAYFKAYPNPFYNILIVESALFEKDVELRITDITGREIFSIQNSCAFYNKDEVQIETGEFKRGVYLLTIIDKETKTPMKIIKLIKA